MRVQFEDLFHLVDSVIANGAEQRVQHCMRRLSRRARRRVGLVLGTVRSSPPLNVRDTEWTGPACRQRSSTSRCIGHILCGPRLGQLPMRAPKPKCRFETWVRFDTFSTQSFARGKHGQHTNECTAWWSTRLDIYPATVNKIRLGRQDAVQESKQIYLLGPRLRPPIILWLSHQCPRIESRCYVMIGCLRAHLPSHSVPLPLLA
jgi:hypothetical protein